MNEARNDRAFIHQETNERDSHPEKFQSANSLQSLKTKTGEN